MIRWAFPLTGGALPEPEKNALSHATIEDLRVALARTGYTGEPLGFELFLPLERAAVVWQALAARAATPVGLGARDTLRLEAGLPLYGHELGQDPEGRPIPIYACGLSRYAVSFSELKGDFIGRAAPHSRVSRRCCLPGAARLALRMALRPNRAWMASRA